MRKYATFPSEQKSLLFYIIRIFFVDLQWNLKPDKMEDKNWDPNDPNRPETEDDELQLGAMRLARWRHQNEQFRAMSQKSLASAIEKEQPSDQDPKDKPETSQ